MKNVKIKNAISLILNIITVLLVAAAVGYFFGDERQIYAIKHR